MLANNNPEGNGNGNNSPRGIDGWQRYWRAMNLALLVPSWTEIARGNPFVFDRKTLLMFWNGGWTRAMLDQALADAHRVGWILHLHHDGVPSCGRGGRWHELEASLQNGGEK